MIGQRIKKLREMKGYSITELADLAKVSKSYLSYIERNLQNNPSVQFIAKIAAPLDTTVEYLLGDDEIDESLEEDWKTLIKGMSKDDLRNFKEFIHFKRWQENKEK